MTETPPSLTGGGDTGGSRGDRSMGWWVIAALVIFVAVAGGIWVIVAGPDGNPETASSPPASNPPVPTATGPSATTPTTSAGSGGCSGRTSTSVPATSPATDWKLISGVALPFSPTFGPAKVQGSQAACFEHSATGALFAAAQISMRLGLPGREQIFQSQVLPGPTRDKLIQSPSPLLSAPYPQWAGFRILAATPDQVSVQLAQRFTYEGQAVMAAHTLQMEWSAGDWKWEMDPPGGYIQPVQVTSLSGFIPWAGV